MNKKWEKKFSTFIMQFIGWFPMVIILLQTFRLGTYDIDFTQFTNPLTNVFASALTSMGFNSTNTGYNIFVYGMSWSCFVELAEIIYIVFIFFLNTIKGFFDREGGKLC